MLKLENVTKRYNDIVAVNNLSFNVNEGEILGLLGLNGAGKTTTFRMILGLIDDYEGNITLDNKKINYEICDNIGYLTEERSLLPKLTVYEQLMYFGKLKSLSDKDINDRLDYLLDRFNIKEYKYKKIKELSKGNCQKIQFISSNINNPRLLILDEPFSGLDPINVNLFKDIIRKLKDGGTIIIISSHLMEHIEEFCEKVIILVKGNVVLEGNLNEIKESYKKKKIIVNGDINKKEISSLEGVIDVTKDKEEYIISIKEKKYINKIFKYLNKYNNITKFILEDISLNDIFIDKVGDNYEK